MTLDKQMCEEAEEYAGVDNTCKRNLNMNGNNVTLAEAASAAEDKEAWKPEPLNLPSLREWEI